MTTRLALLGSINIGGNRIKMADLREKLSARGFGAVETVAASGNVILSSDEDAQTLADDLAAFVEGEFGITGFVVVRSVDEAVALLAGEPASVIGGAAIFDVFLPIATRAELTEIHADFDGDVFMRPLPAGWGVVAREDHGEDGDRPAYSFVSYERDEDSAA